MYKKWLKTCRLCPRQCGIDRTAGQSGFCGITHTPAIYQHFFHLGEEITLVPAFIINMAGCNLTCPTCPEKCRFNAPPLPVGTPERYANALARHFERTQIPKSIEWIGGEPALQLPFVLETSQNLKKLLPHCPPIYLNTNAYFHTDLIPSMQGIIDAFVFDLKAMPACQHIVGNAPNYWQTVTACIQTAVKTYPSDAPHIIRHLVMPGHIDCCTAPILAWCKENVSHVCINLMTTFHDFRQNIDSPTELTAPEIAKAKAIATRFDFPALMINGQFAKSDPP